MARNKNGPPQLLLFYNVVAALHFGPRLYTYLQLRPSTSLILHTTTIAFLISAIAFIAIDASLGISRVTYKFLGLLLRYFLDYHIDTSIAEHWKLSDSTEWLLGAVIGISTIIYSIKIKAGGWENAKRNVAASHKAQTKPAAAKDLGTAERGGVPKQDDHEPWFLWGCWAYMYSSALFESRDWFDSVIRGQDVSQSSRGETEWASLFGPMVIAGAVVLARRRYLKKSRREPVEEKEHVGEEGATVTEKQ